MQPERDSIEAVAVELGHECVRAETLDAPGISPEEACRRMARTCDIYVGIFGGRYGFQVPKLGCSATEIEFREARATNAGKVFVYVKETEDIGDAQRAFLQEVQDFSSGYFRHERFETPSHVGEQ